MSLAGQDDYPGCWGDKSKDWPVMVFENEESAQRAFVACSLEHVVPYGSYVKAGLEIRIENQDFKDDLRDHLINPNLIDYETLMKIQRNPEAKKYAEALHSLLGYAGHISSERMRSQFLQEGCKVLGLDWVQLMRKT